MTVSPSYPLKPYYFSSGLGNIDQTFPEHVSRCCLQGWRGYFLGFQLTQLTLNFLFMPS
jgi:hypothetical protein